MDTCNELIDFLYEQMKMFPDATISYGSDAITYAELLRHAKSSYKNFTHKKYGIMCKNVLETVKAIFCCLFSGSTAIILSDRYGEIYCNKVIEKVKISYIVDDYGIKKISPEKEEVDDISDVAYIMCTSGTTGNPKAAMITYKNVLCNVCDILKYFKVNSRDKTLIIRPLCHMSALTGELFVSLASGADIVFSSLGYDPFEILRILRKNQISVFCTTPTVINQIASLCKNREYHIQLKKIAISGECMTEAISKKVVSVFKEAEVYNVYGLTEASPRVSYLPSTLFKSNPTSVGIALDSVALKIVNDELYISGNNIMKGYYDDKELTQKVICNGWLKTGDVAFFDLNGLLYINGRKDNLIIRAGVNIYPQEIESCLMQDEQIQNVMAYGFKNDDFGERIGIKVVSEHLTETDVFEICKQLLPFYQFPDKIECVDNLDKNESGKIIRKQYM